jgi:outer membrane protein insertion porin family
VESKIEKDSVDLEMRIYEGDQATVNQVIIVGNTRTNEHVVRRELWTKPGDLFSKSDIQRSVRQLAQLGHFDPEKLDVKPLPNPANGTVDLRYVLEERANDQFEISGGWGANMFVGTVGIRFSNFAVRRFFERGAWRPVPSGDGQSLALRASTNGSYYKSFSLSFTEPWLGGKKPTNFSFSIYHTIQNNAAYLGQPSSQYFKVTGGSVGIGTRLKWPDDYFTLYHEVNLQNYLLKDWASGGFLFSNGQSNNFSYKITLGRNSTDQQIYPRVGSNFSLSLQITPPYSAFKKSNFWLLPAIDETGLTSTQIATQKAERTQQEQALRYKWIEYHKWSGRAQWYMSLVQNLVLYTNAQFGILGYFSKSLGHSPFEGFDLGGDGMSGYNLYGRETIGLRGYQNSSLTPVVNGARSANIYNKYTMELRYPLSLKPQAAIYVLTFMEAGNAWAGVDDFNPFNVHRSAGLGARMFLPMLGMLGIDWAYGFDEVAGNPTAHKGQFHFVIGMPF